MNNYFMGQDGFSWFIGVVEDRNDPKVAGRVRVRCLGYHSEDVNDIPTEELPWATPMMPVTAGANSGVGMSPTFLIEGTWVVGFFRDPAKQEPVIMGALPGINDTLERTNSTIASCSERGGQSTKGGFKDPNDKFPTATYLNLPDTNVLAQGRPSIIKSHYTYYAKKYQSDTHYPPGPEGKGSTTADTAQKLFAESWQKASNVSGNSTTATNIVQQTNTQADAKYPYNHVFESESGHYVEFDDTPGNERIQIHHRKGTFIEIHPDGNVTVKGIGNVTNIIDGDLDTRVHGNYSLTVEGNLDVWAKGNMTELVNGERSTTIKGNEYVEITGAVDQYYESTLDLSVMGDVTNTFEATLKTDIVGVAAIKSGAAMTIGGSSISFN